MYGLRWVVDVGIKLYYAGQNMATTANVHYRPQTNENEKRQTDELVHWRTWTKTDEVSDNNNGRRGFKTFRRGPGTSVPKPKTGWLVANSGN